MSPYLLGREVRYNSGHKRDAFMTDTLGRFAEFVLACPEVELGLGVPRETLRLMRAASKFSARRMGEVP